MKITGLKDYYQEKADAEMDRVLKNDRDALNMRYDLEKAMELLNQRGILIVESDDDKWISVNDRLPKLGTFVIAYYNRANPIVLGLYYNLYKEFMYGKQNHTSKISHWQELPEPPQQ